MKYLLSFLLVSLGTFAHAQAPFSQCAAAFVDQKMIVDTYAPTGKSVLTRQATGTLTVQTVVLSAEGSKAIDKLGFKLAIRDKATGTLSLVSDETYQQVPVQRVLATCQPGDRIVLLTTDRRYSLPHNEIEVR